MKADNKKILFIFKSGVWCMIFCVLFCGYLHSAGFEKLAENTKNTESSKNLSNNHKVILICLDGASWNVMEPLIKKNKLPVIKYLIKNGAYGSLRTIHPMKSEVIWTTIATGKNPFQHGIVDRIMDNPDSGEAIPPTSNQRRVKALWNILSERGKTVGIVNYMVTRPPEKINGIMVSGSILDFKGLDYFSKDRSTPSFAELFSKDVFDNFKIPATKIFADIPKDEFPFFWRGVESIDNFVVNVSKYFLKKQNFDFFCFYLRGIDIASHEFWAFRFPRGLKLLKADTSLYGRIIDNYYIWADKVIADILQIIDKETTVFVVSDHGFTAGSRDNYYLTNMDDFLKVCGIDEIKKDGHIITMKNDVSEIFFFLKNIKISGFLSNQEFYEVREKAKKILLDINIAETGEPLLKEIRNTKNGFIIEFEKTKMKANINSHFIFNNKEYSMANLFTNFFCRGTHAEDGVFIAFGKNIYPNHRIANASVLDVTPTILYYLGLPVAKDMAGKVLEEAINEKIYKNYPVSFIDSYEAPLEEKPVQEKPIRFIAEEEKAREIMRSLGYIN